MDAGRGVHTRPVAASRATDPARRYDPGMFANPKLIPLCLCLLLAPVVAQKPAPAAPPPVDPALPDQCKELKSLVADPKMTADFQAIGLVQKLVKDPEQRNPKDKERIAKAFGDVFTTGKLRPADKDALYRETGDALGKLEADGAKELAKVLGDARFKDLTSLRAHLILALGKTKDEKQADWLLDQTTRSPHDEIRAAAGEALGNYKEADIKLRREVVKQLVREWGSLHSSATTAAPTDPNVPIDPGPENARRTLRAVEGKWNATLAALTSLSMTQFADWQRWLNKNPGWTSGSKKP